MKSKTAFWFYFGTLISSIGSFTFNICLIAFMIQSGFDLFHVSLILGLQRMIPLFVSGLLGHHTDKLSPRLTVVVAEFGAAATTFGILWAWSQGHSGYWPLLVFSLVKTSIVSFQVGSKAKLTKILSGDSYESNASHAIWFNKATQGATLFAGICALPIIKYFNFETAIWFDLITFAVNGFIVWQLPFQEPPSSGQVEIQEQTVLTKFKDFYNYNGRASILDGLLAVSMMGTTSFTARLAGNDQKWVAILIGSYGAAVWLSGFLEKTKFLKSRSLPLWAGLGISYALLGFYPQYGFVTVVLALFKDTFYWLLLHRISSHIQMDTPQKVMGSVTSARVTQMVIILATGELMVGLWSKTVPILFDGLWRGVFCFVVMALLSAPKFQAEKKHGYAKL